MSQRSIKTFEFKKQFRNEQLSGIINQKRSSLIAIQEQEDLYRQNGTYGLELLKSLSAAQDRQCIKKLRNQYPLNTLIPFLDTTYDGSEYQLFALNLIGNYLHIGYAEPPEEHLVDRLLRILMQGIRVDAIKIILFIFIDILQDHFKYSTFLVQSKKIVHKLLWVFQTYINSHQVKNLVYRCINHLVENVSWHQDLIMLIDPLFYMMNQSQKVDKSAMIETLLNIIQVNTQIIAPILYEKKIHKMCLSVMYQHQSRVATLAYLKFMVQFERFLQLDDVSSASEAVAYIHSKQFKVGSGMARFSVYEIKLTTYRFLNILLRSQTGEFRQAAISLISSMHEQIKNEIEVIEDQNTLFVLTKIFLGFYLQSSQKFSQSLQSMIKTAIDKCYSNRRSEELLIEYDHLVQLRGTSLHEQMEIESI